MRAAIPNADALQPAVRESFEFLTSRINTVFQTEHNGDGTHSDITADSIVVTGDVMVGDDITVTDNVVVGGSIVATGSVVATSMATTTGSIVSGASLFERGRTAAIGEWTTPTFAAGDFTGSGTITWTVAAGDVVTMAYMLVGKSMTFSLVLNTTTVAGVGAALQVLIPGGFTAAKTMRNAAEAVDNGVRTTARIGAVAASTILLIQRTDIANWTASVDNTNISAQITFEVQ